MGMHYGCDFCGAPIDDERLKVSIRARGLAEERPCRSEMLAHFQAPHGRRATVWHVFRPGGSRS